jgi:hypothetical protein
VAKTLTYGIEIAVGAACLLAAPGGGRRIRWLGAVLVVAGLAAVIHGAFALATA